VLLAVGALVAVRGEELRPALLAAAAGVAVTGLLVFQQPLRAQLRLKALASADVGGSVLVLALVVALSLGELRAWEVVLVMAAANGVCCSRSRPTPSTASRCRRSCRRRGLARADRHRLAAGHRRPARLPRTSART
jgi:hypothetical protein